MKREGSISGLPAYAESLGGKCKKPAIKGGSPLTTTETLPTVVVILFTVKSPFINLKKG